MRNHKLDQIDRKILRVLRDHARVSNVELAESVGISPPPCLRRVRALKDANDTDHTTAQTREQARTLLRQKNKEREDKKSNQKS